MRARDCDADDIAAWLRLLETPQVGRESARRLLAAFGSPQAALAANVAARKEVVGAGPAQALSQAADGHAELLKLTLDWLAQTYEAERHLIALGDPDYPTTLFETADPPLLLYAIGRVELLRAQSLAVVGSRNPTPQGRENATAFAAHLGHAGLTIVSGLALGVDGAAHAGALGTPGRTIAVVGTGLDRVYPKRHLDLARRIADNGLIVSEYSLGTPPLAPNFPLRNRIIAGMTRGTLVVEATLQSGSLITARLAVEAGREVFAIPGSIHSPQSKGCHTLIKQGAKLVETAQDILEELRWPVVGMAADAKAQPDRSTEHPILAAMGHDPISLDELVRRTGWSAAELNVRLLELELDGQVARLPGQSFQRIGQG
jgi:DNA processing protein